MPELLLIGLTRAGTRHVVSEHGWACCGSTSKFERRWWAEASDVTCKRCPRDFTWEPAKPDET
jgi:hypothetical protein